MMKEMLHSLPEWEKAAKDSVAALDQLEGALIRADAALRHEATATVEPVRYEIRVEPVAVH